MEQRPLFENGFFFHGFPASSENWCSVNFARLVWRDSRTAATITWDFHGRSKTGGRASASQRKLLLLIWIGRMSCLFTCQASDPAFPQLLIKG